MLRAFLLGTLALLAACSPPEDPPSVVPESAFSEPVLPQKDAKPEQQNRITIAADPWCPHNCEAGSEREGYMVEIAKEAFAMARLEVRYINMSWARALQQADDGHIDAVVGAFIGDAPDFVFPDEAIGYAGTALYTNTESHWTYQGVDSLKYQKLLAINGYSYSPKLDAYIEQHQDDPDRVWIISGPSPLDRAIEILEQGRSDVLLEDRYVMQWTLEQLGQQVNLRLVSRLPEAPIYIAFSPANSRSPELAALLTDGVRKLRESGRLNEILAGYGLSWSD